MKKLLISFGAVALIAYAIGGIGEVVIKEAPLTWKQAALSDGGELYAELCAVCHGVGGRGDGPAAPALKMGVPDLAALTAGHGGTFPRERVESAITGGSRTPSHGSVEMPIWGSVFADVRPEWKGFRRDGFARQRIYNLTDYLESLQTE